VTERTVEESSTASQSRDGEEPSVLHSEGVEEDATASPPDDSSESVSASTLTLDLVDPGPLGDGWSSVEATTTEIRISGGDEERTLRYPEIDRVATFPVGGSFHGDITLVVGLLALVLGGTTRLLLAVVNRLAGTNFAVPRLRRYVNEFLTMRDLTRVRLVTDDGSVYCYVEDEAAAEKLVERVETYAHLD
jgi:hypothetical protein